MTQPEGPTRAGFIAIIGAPNAGKSTLINRLIGSKIAIVTHKVQTTRSRLRGVAMHGAAQLVFVDTPGIFKPRRRLDEAMVAAAWEGAGEADIVALLVDAQAYIQRGEGGAFSKASIDTDAIIEKLKQSKTKPILVLNKVDLVARPALLELAQTLHAKADFSDTFMISAEKGDGVKDFLAHCAGRMPEGPWLYPEDQAADIPLRQIAAEIVREKLTLRLHEELPYVSTVETENWEDRKDGSARIEATIYVQKSSQKSIVLGKGGQTIKDIGQAARHDISALIERPVHLFLFVKVRENWGDDPDRYRAMGLDFGKKKKKR